jgi:hypothetical protein
MQTVQKQTFGLIQEIFLIAAFLFSILFAYGNDGVSGLLRKLDFSGNSSDPGWIYKLDPSAGLRLRKHLEIADGIPIYLVRVPDSGAADGFISKQGIGDAYLSLNQIFSRGDFSYTGILKGAAPTGNQDDGFSTGRATVDWSNYFDIGIGKWTPFGSIGIANTVSDTHFFNRPFSSLGLVAHFEGGASFQPVRWIRIAGSAYAVAPAGQQKIYSKLIARRSLETAAGKSGRNPNAAAGNGRIFVNTDTAVGGSEISKDHGVSGWIDLTPRSDLTLDGVQPEHVLGERQPLLFHSPGFLEGPWEKALKGLLLNVLQIL